MEELIFFAVIIFFSILESVARTRKGKAGGETDGPLPESREREAGQPDLQPGRPTSRGSGDLPAYDDDPSYDDPMASEEGMSYHEIALERRQRREDRSLDRYKTPTGTDRPTRETPRTSRPSSETMLPGDLLEQLEGLARGRQVERERARTVDLPDQSPPLPTPIERTEVGTGHASTDPVGTRGPVGSTAPVGSRTPVRSRSPIGEHFVHGSHAGYGTDPSSRARSEQDGLDPLAEYLDSDGVAVRRQLFGGRAGLRQAFVLKEVLGPPKALRGDDSAGY